MTLISRCLSYPSRAVVVLLAAWALVTTSADAATLTVSGSGLSVQGGASVCTYSSISESGAGNWSVVCGSGSHTISINPPVNGTVCASYTSITESGLGNWTVQGCGSLSPTITLDAPSQGGQTYPTGTAFTLKATATVPSGRTVSSVQFFADGNLIHAGNLSGSQYVWDWTPATGTYLVLARVTDSTGATADSASRQMIFQPQGTVFYVHPDQLGTPRAITRASDNQVVWRWDNTEAFGNSAPNENPSGLGAFTYNLRFPGQYFDGETGTAYNHMRDYDAATGRYLESDPIDLRGGLNTYVYVKGDSLSQVDRLGLYAGPAGGTFEGQPGMGAGNDPNLYAVPGLIRSCRFRCNTVVGVGCLSCLLLPFPVNIGCGLECRAGVFAACLIGCNPKPNSGLSCPANNWSLSLDAARGRAQGNGP